MFKTAILLGFVAVCWAQTPVPCESPKQWEGRRVMTDQSKEFQEIAKYSYDAENLRTRAIEERTVGKERDYYDVLNLYRENKEYRLNLRTRKCNVTTPSHPFFETRVPPGSKFLFEAEAGAAQVPGEHLTVQNWDITFTDGAKYAIAVTSPDCVPIFAAYYSKEVGFLIENATSPKQWTGRRVRFDRFRQYTEFGRHYYDEMNMRTRTVEERDVGKERDYYDTLHLHSVGLEYRLNIRTKQCNVTRLTLPFRYIGVPPTSKFLFEAVIGAADVPSEHLTAATFNGNFPDGAAYIVTVGYPDCVPISFDVRSNTTMEHFGERYYDLHLGVSDPAAFIPPTECEKSFEE